MKRKSFQSHKGGGQIFGKLFFAITVILCGIITIGALSLNVYAVPGDATAEPTTSQNAEEEANGATADETADGAANEAVGSGGGATGTGTADTNAAETTGSEAEAGAETETAGASSGETGEKSCKKSLGALGWLVCPTTGKIAEAIDWLYDKIEGILIINPISSEDGSPIYEIWKYLRGLTNIVFIIFLLIVVYSQVTGFGISNYGVKKALPKLILAAVLVNLSFLICSLLVDASNIVGHSLRGVFKTIEENTFTGTLGLEHVSMSSLYSALGSTAGIGALGGLIAFESGAIWMLIPTILGGLVAVASGLITVALRQAVVVLLIMIAPLAMVAYILPNTEDLFKKWKNLLIRMLVFYPMFSLLFGASSLAGWAIIVSAHDGFGVLLGIAVQIFPLFFSWSLMKMSGTFLSKINGALQGLGDGLVASNARWAMSHRNLTRARNLEKEDPISPTLQLAQGFNNRRVAREIDTKELNENIARRGAAYAARRNYRSSGLVSAHGEEAEARLARSMEYGKAIEKYHNDLNEGMGVVNAKVREELAASGNVRASRIDARQIRLDSLDVRSMNASDRLFDEKARGEDIEYKNAKGRQERYDNAIHAHFDSMNDDERAKLRGEGKKVPYARHFDTQSEEYRDSLERYQNISRTMHSDEVATQYAAAVAASASDTQTKIHASKFQKHFEYTESTRDIEYRLGELTKSPFEVSSNIDSIVAGMRVLNQRGDTDLVKAALDNTLKTVEGKYGEEAGGIKLGTHASQSLASFLMFEVKDNDPFLRRFGKFINLETAAVYSGNRLNEQLTYSEYLTGMREEYVLDENGQIQMQDTPNGAVPVTKFVPVRKPGTVLMKGTSLDGIERTAMIESFDKSLQNAYTKNGKLDVDAYIAKRTEYEEAIGPAFISSSLKHPSESEALVSEVAFLTGVSNKPLKDKDGQIVVDSKGKITYTSEYDWDTVKGASDEDREKIKKHHREQTLQYIKAQTPSQILGLRTDYRDGLMLHLSDQWFEDHPEDYDEYIKAVAEIQGKYGDLPPEEARKKREKDEKALRAIYFGREFRALLSDDAGTLGQIYNLRGSSSVSNTKAWVREGLGLNNNEIINAYYKKYGYPKKKPRKNGLPIDDADDEGSSDASTVRVEIENLFNNGDITDNFYNDTLVSLRSHYGHDSPIVAEYMNFHDELTGGGNVVQDKGVYMDELNRLIDKYGEE